MQKGNQTQQTTTPPFAFDSFVGRRLASCLSLVLGLDSTLLYYRIKQHNMSSHDNEELIDYEDEHDVVPNGATATATNGAAAVAADGEAGRDGRNFSGIHSTGFRYAGLSRKSWRSC